MFKFIYSCAVSQYVCLIGDLYAQCEMLVIVVCFCQVMGKAQFQFLRNMIAGKSRQISVIFNDGYSYERV